MSPTIDEVTAAKRLVWDAWSGRTETALHRDVVVHASAPIGRLDGVEATQDGLHHRLATSLPAHEWEPYLFLGGVWDDQVWVAHTGHITGVFDQPLWGIPPSGRTVSVRYGDFSRVENGATVEVRILFDIVGLAAQAGIHLLPEPPARNTLPPGPGAGNGIVGNASDPAETASTLRLVEDMLGGCNRLDGSDLASMGMAAYWHDDMVWHGPHGIGSSFGFQEFQDFAQGPSVSSFPNRRGGFHQARFADGLTAAFTGWPSLQGDFTGAPFRGIEPTGGPIGQNIMDFYVRRGDKLHENWVLIDLIDFAAQCGVDLLKGLHP
ncbi:MAG: ester cyclase [Actinomycetota bacterium]